MQFLNK